MRSWIRAIGLLAGAALLAASCGAAVTPTPAPTSTPAVEQTAEPTPAPTPQPTARPTPTPVPATDGEGDEIVIGTQTGDVTTSYTMERVGDVLQYRNGVVTTTDTTNDVRATGTGTYSFNVDDYTTVGREWGTYRLENAGGSWEGPCTGGIYTEDVISIMTCWLVGGGGYEGYTYYQFREGERLQGVIYRGSPPPTP